MRPTKLAHQRVHPAVPRPGKDDVPKTDSSLAFLARFGHRPAVAVRAPGRVNLIGEHTDYNQGLALPIAIERSTHVYLGPNKSGLVRVHSNWAGSSYEFDPEGIVSADGFGWTEYVRGAVWVLSRRGHRIRGSDLLIESNLPVGEGLSSSASLTTALLLSFAAGSNLHLEASEIARMSQDVENDFLGIGSGSMDQLVILHAFKNNALLIDFGSGRRQQVPCASLSVMILGSGTHRDLYTSNLNARRFEAKAVASGLDDRGIAVAEVGKEGYKLPATMYGELPSSTLVKRLLHIEAENQRVLQFVHALESSDGQRLGELLIESHRSLSSFYEVSTESLDLLVDLVTTRFRRSFHGARLTGAGFGGAVIGLLTENWRKEDVDELSQIYHATTGLTLSPLRERPSAGARVEMME